MLPHITPQEKEARQTPRKQLSYLHISYLTQLHVLYHMHVHVHVPTSHHGRKIDRLHYLIYTSESITCVVHVCTCLYMLSPMETDGHNTTTSAAVSVVGTYQSMSTYGGFTMDFAKRPTN